MFGYTRWILRTIKEYIIDNYHDIKGIGYNDEEFIGILIGTIINIAMFMVNFFIFWMYYNDGIAGFKAMGLTFLVFGITGLAIYGHGKYKLEKRRIAEEL